jgi:protein-disulfide isomerase
MTRSREQNGKSAHKTQAINKEMRNLLLLGLPVFVIIFVLGVLYNSSRQGDTNIGTVGNEQLIRSDSPTLGPVDAPVTLVEFLDPECESCRAAFPFVKQLLEEYDQRVRLVVRYFPLHNNSVLAAAATEAAGEQGMYWEMQELLFTRQPEWGEKQTPQTELFIQYATELGLNVDQFTADLQNPEHLTKIDRDQADGRELGVTGTPSFFVNGRRVEDLSAASIIAMIDEELSR